MVLPRTHLDHHPIKFVDSARDAPPRHERPFRFEAAWLLRHDYHDIWKAAWSNRTHDVVGAIEEVTTRSKEWNKTVFGNIFNKKRNLQNRIVGFKMLLLITILEGFRL